MLGSSSPVSSFLLTQVNTQVKWEGTVAEWPPGSGRGTHLSPPWLMPRARFLVTVSLQHLLHHSFQVSQYTLEARREGLRPPVTGPAVRLSAS